MTALSNQLASWFDAVLMMSLQAGIIVVVILSLQQILWNRLTAGWRHALWFLLFVCLLVPFRFASPVSLFHLSDHLFKKIQGQDTRALEETLQSRLGYDVIIVDESSYGHRTIDSPSIGPGHTDPIQKKVSHKIQGNVPEKTSRDQSPHLVKHAWPLEILVAWVWISGSVLSCLVWLASEIRFRSRIQSCPEIEDEHTRNFFKCVQKEVGMGAQVKLVECSWNHGPAVVGWFRKVLILPLNFHHTFDESSKRHVFLHELAHIRRCDLETAAIMNFLLCLHWFNPLMWLAAWRMKHDRELAADELALHFIDKEEKELYGETLIQLLSRSGGADVFSGRLGMAESKAQLKERMKAIASYRTDKRSFGLGGSSFLVLAGLGLSDVDELDVSPVPADAEHVYVMAQHPAGSPKFDREVLTTNPDGPPHPIQTIRLKVVNDQTGEPVSVFKVYGWETSQLRPLFTLEGKGGQLEIPQTVWEIGDGASPSADSIMLNIESEGFFASHSESLLGTRRNEGVLEYEFRMVSQRAIQVKVRTSQGKPVPDVKVNFLDGKLMRQSFGKSGPHRKRAHYVGLTDLNGAFEITPSNADIFSKQIVVACSDGVHIGFLKNQPEYEIVLQPWGRLEGVVRLAGTPIAGMSVNKNEMSSRWETHIDVLKWWLYDSTQHITTTDSEGRFAFENIIPGKIQLNVGQRNDGLEDVIRVVEIAPGASERMEFEPKRARQVYGSVRLPSTSPEFEDIEGAKIGAAFPQSIGSSPAIEDLKSSFYFHPRGMFGRLPNGAQGLNLHWLRKNKFQIQDVPPGEYHILVAVRSSANSFNTQWEEYLCKMIVPGPESKNAPMPALDLGRLDFKRIGPDPLREGNGSELVFNAFDSQGVDFGPGHFRGRYVLLHFWHSGDDGNRRWQQELEVVNRRKSEFSATILSNGISEKRHRFEIISMGVDENAMNLKNFMQDHPLEWKHGFMNAQSAEDLLQQLNVDSLPKAVLLDRSGKVILSSSSVSDVSMILNEELDKMRQSNLWPTF